MANPVFSVARKYAALFRNSLRMRPELFDPGLGRKDSEALFKKYVEMVEVETCSFCNRTCRFCPNSYLDRHSKKDFMPEGVWKQIISPLSTLGYDGALVWARYSEPLGDISILARVREARKALPLARLTAFSNGDFLSHDYVRELEASGLNWLVVNAYLPEDVPFTAATAEKHCRALAAKAGCHFRMAQSTRYYAVGYGGYGKLKMSIACTDFTARPNVVDRGGLMKKISREGFSRTSPCFSPFKSVLVDWDGSVMPCCQMRSDAPEHKGCIAGHIREGGDDVVDAYLRLAQWRRRLRGFEAKPGPCLKCENSVYPCNKVARSAAAMCMAVGQGIPGKWMGGVISCVAGGKRNRWSV